MSDSEFTRFVFTVEKMRDLQKQYFKTRDRDTLILSKEQEKVVDNWVKNLKREFTDAALASTSVVAEK